MKKHVNKNQILGILLFVVFSLTSQRTVMAMWVEYGPVAKPGNMTTSRYVTWLTGDKNVSKEQAYSVACSQASTERPGVVILGFGRQLPEGVSQFRGRRSPKSLDEVRETLVSYARGLSECSKSLGEWSLVAQTSNDHLEDAALGFQQGKVWASMISDVSGAMPTAVSLYGGSDIEPSWGSYEAALAWVEGFYSVISGRLILGPSADGCPKTGGDGGCNNGWSAAKMANLVWGVDSSTRLYPQIYHHRGAQAMQWANIATTALSLGLTPSIEGVMTQARACSRPGTSCRETGISHQTALEQMQAAYRDAGLTNPPLYATDIGWG